MGTPSVRQKRFVAYGGNEVQAPTEPTKGQGPCGSHAPRPPRRHPEPSPPTSRVPPFTTKRFHVLLNSLFKVLFNFPSRYLFASARCDEAFPNTTFRATEMAGSSVLGSARF